MVGAFCYAMSDSSYSRHNVGTKEVKSTSGHCCGRGKQPRLMQSNNKDRTMQSKAQDLLSSTCSGPAWLRSWAA